MNREKRYKEPGITVFIVEHNSIQAFAEFAVLSSLCDVWLLLYNLAANSRVGNSHMVQMSVVVSCPAFPSFHLLQAFVIAVTASCILVGAMVGALGYIKSWF